MKKKTKTKIFNAVLTILIICVAGIVIVGSIISIISAIQHSSEWGEKKIISHIENSNQDVKNEIMEYMEDNYEDIESHDSDIDYLHDKYLMSSDEINATLKYLNLELYTEKVKISCVLCKEINNYCENPEQETFCNYEDVTKVRKIK